MTSTGGFNEKFNATDRNLVTRVESLKFLKLTMAVQNVNYRSSKEFYEKKQSDYIQIKLIIFALCQPTVR